MTCLIILCWAYLIFLILGRIANIDKKDSCSVRIRENDNFTIITLIIILVVIYFLK
jgi:hypothetical protein